MTKEEAIEELERDEHIETNPKKKEALNMGIKALKQDPEIPKGKWSKKEYSMLMMCSHCGKGTIYGGMNNYIFCPNCGADMRGEE